ncbi:hypothetical protein A5703_25110 [Mycobacterium sp. E188]|nr:hypothetical protein A5703_25110 [Mycobacterium sp. E188]OBH32728.1 hypothetical protein A5691_11925 [Mycobacterium sp. E183]
MAESEKIEQPETGADESPGTQPPDTQGGGPTTGRIQATQALFRPDFDDDDDDFPHISLGTLDSDPQDRVTVGTRVLPPVRHLGVGGAGAGPSTVNHLRYNVFHVPSRRIRSRVPLTNRTSPVLVRLTPMP